MDQRPQGKAKGAQGGIIALVVVAGMLLGVTAVSPAAMAAVLWDGAPAAAIVLAATGLGLGILRGLGPNEIPLRWRLLGAAGLGLGGMSLLVLGLGVIRILHRPIWIGVLIIFAGCGLLQLRRLNRRSEDASTGSDAAWMRWLWLGVIAFGALALLAGTMPPGTLWPEEGNGYDVLEYHLGVPREYVETGHISYLPHNIYSNFPFNVEMLYLLAMVLHGDAVGAALTANLLNVMLGMLAVAAVWLAGREYGRGGGVVAGLIAASCPFITYLSGVAYVENGTLMFAALGLAAMLRAGRLSAQRATKWIVLAGLFAGLACGCKYTAIPAVFIPLTVASAGWVLTQRLRTPALPVVFVFAALVTFGPWLVKNVVMTSNPVFPLARGVFGERAGIWNNDGAGRWHEGHLPAPEDRAWPRRLARLWPEVLGAKLFGPALVIAVAAGGIGGRVWLRRNPAMKSLSPNIALAPATGQCHTGRSVLDPCWLMVIIGIVAWTGWTHLVGRFAVTLIVPAAVIVGRSWQSLERNATRAVGVAVIVGVLAVNTYTTYGLFAGRPLSFFELGVFGRTDVVTAGHWPAQQHLPRLNELLARGEKVLVVGDARRFYLARGADYCVVFSRNPFAEAAASLAPEALVEWLRARQYRWVYVDWTEMHRLQTTRYGFWAGVDGELFARLAAVGLRAVEDFAILGRGTKYATLFEVRGP